MENSKVCIVDDEQELVETYADYLKGTYEVRSFNSAQAALDAFDKDYLPDVVLTDLKMPGMDGSRFIDALHSKNINKPVIIMSGHADKSNAIRAFDQDVSGFLEKPFEPALLRSSIKKSLASGALARSNEHLILELARLSENALALVKKYRDRYIHAENVLFEAKINSHPTRKQVLDFLDETRSESALEDNIEISRSKVKELMEARNSTVVNGPVSKLWV